MAGRAGTAVGVALEGAGLDDDDEEEEEDDDDDEEEEPNRCTSSM